MRYTPPALLAVMGAVAWAVGMEWWLWGGLALLAFVVLFGVGKDAWK